jgi:hypothetical protein
MYIYMFIYGPIRCVYAVGKGLENNMCMYLYVTFVPNLLNMFIFIHTNISMCIHENICKYVHKHISIYTQNLPIDPEEI